MASKNAPGLPLREVVAYYTGPEGTIPTSESVLKAQAGKISYITGFWYQIDPETGVDLVPVPNTSAGEIARTVDLAHSLGVKVEMLFQNITYNNPSTSAKVINRLMDEPALTERLAENLQELVQRYGFDGVNIDLEHVPAPRRAEFTAFVRTVAGRLKQQGIRVSISVPAKTGDNPQSAWAGAYDYAALGALVDRMVLMTYDEHGWTSSAGPIASIDWVSRVASYAVTQVPAHKILLGVPAYGFDWTTAAPSPVYLDFHAAMAPVHRREAVLQWDEAAQAPKYSYTDARGHLHRVWFENASSSAGKLDLVERFGLRGVALWRAGMEDPAFWTVVGQKMRPEK